MEEFCQALPASSYLELHGSRRLRFSISGSTAAARPQSRSDGAQELPDRARELHAGYGASPTEASIIRSNLLRHSAAQPDSGRDRDCLRWAAPGSAGARCRPVDEITAAARAISIDNLSQRLPVPATGDELERLTEVWNTMLARLESAVKTLSQFAADASHELRTPLAVIRTSAELALRRAREPESLSRVAWRKWRRKPNG